MLFGNFIIIITVFQSERTQHSHDKTDQKMTPPLPHKNSRMTQGGLFIIGNFIDDIHLLTNVIMTYLLYLYLLWRSC